MVFRVSVLGTPKSDGLPSTDDNLLLRCLALVTDSEIALSTSSQADLVLIHPYRFPLRSTLSGAVAESGARVLGRLPSGPSTGALFRRIYGIPEGKPTLAVSFENLDRRPWQAFGNLIRQAGIPRLTFWPTDVDPDGFRFPYWWNYVDWQDVPRPGAGERSRFGALYSLEQLCSPMELGVEFRHRMKKAVWVTSHLDFPRDGVLRSLCRHIDVEVLTGIPQGKKLQALRQYQYCVTTENSTGYGYQTEKIPEAWASGCVPVGYIANPYSDFSPDSHFFAPPTELPDRLPPLLRTTPTLTGLLSYLASIVGSRKA